MPGLSLRVTADDVRMSYVFYLDKNAPQHWLSLGRSQAVTLADSLGLARHATHRCPRVEIFADKQAAVA